MRKNILVTNLKNHICVYNSEFFIHNQIINYFYRFSHHPSFSYEKIPLRFLKLVY